MPNALEIVDERFSLSIMEIILTLGDQAFGMSILLKLNEGNTYIDLVYVYEALIDLLHNGRITYRLSDEDDARSRKIYQIVLPEGMVPYGPDHKDYPNKPEDWDKGPVLHLAGDLPQYLDTEDNTRWLHDSFNDGTNIIAYTKQPSTNG